MKERDERPLDEIRFAQDVDRPAMARIEKEVRVLLARAGVQVAQDIIDLGCTGLVMKLTAPEGNAGVALVTSIRKHMSGSICGLPCYVPRDRYCLVHDTIGGLQLAGNIDGPQAQRHPEALSLMSRELTEDERKKVFGINAKIKEEARKGALAEYGAEELDGDGDHCSRCGRVLEGIAYNPGTAPDWDGKPLCDTCAIPNAVAPSCPVPLPPFKCPEHTEPDWECRKCIAQAIVEDNREITIATMEVRSERGGQVSLDVSNRYSLEGALNSLAEGGVDKVELWVRVASWSKKVTRD